MMKENWVYCRGDIYCAKLDPVVGSEQGGIRPVIVIQNDTGNKHAPTLIVATVTTRIHKKANMPTHFVIYDNPAFKEASVVQLEQIRTIDKSRIDNYFSVKRYEVIKELGDRLIAWREKSSRVLLIFDFRLALQGLFVGMPGFPLLFGFSVFVHIVVNNGIVFLSLDYRCHIVLPFLDHRSRESSHSSNDRLEMRMALPIRTILKCPSFTRIYAEVLPMPRI